MEHRKTEPKLEAGGNVGNDEDAHLDNKYISSIITIFLDQQQCLCD